MTLAKEISTILEDDNEPLCKRLKMADNAFKSSEIPLQCRPLLLKWILKSSPDATHETWETLRGWLYLNYFKNLGRNEISNKEIKGIIKLLIDKMESTGDMGEKTLETVMNILELLIENTTFQQYLVTRIKDYCRLIVSILGKIQNPVRFISFMKSNILFYKSIILAEDFLPCFLSIVLPKFVENFVKFESNEVFMQVSKVIQKCVFYSNRKSFVNFMEQFFTGVEQEVQLVPTTVLQYLLEVRKLDDGMAKVHYKLLFDAFSVAYDDFQLLHRFFVVMLYLQGFELSAELTVHASSTFESPDQVSLDESSLSCTLELLKVLSETKTDLSSKIKDLTFSDLLKDMLTLNIFPRKSSGMNYEIISEIIKINPLIVQTLTDQIVLHSMMANNSEHKEAYEKLIVSMFDTYSKLHRVESMVSKMVVSLNKGIDGSYAGKDIHSASQEADKEMEHFKLQVEDMFTENILATFSKCISSLASWQIINVFKTLLYSLKGSLERLQEGEDSQKSDIYMQILSCLIGTFLSSIRVAEHTVTSNVIDKTTKCLDELQELLRTFGIHLLNREHDHILMRSFLNIAYYWAEITITLRFYSVSQKAEDDKFIDSNYSSCNLTFIHSYLSAKEWCLISERITNFGEPPCKQLMYKLFIQRVRALHVFLPKVNDDIVTNLLRDITKDLEHIWKYFLEDRFSVNILLPRMDTNTIVLLAEYFMAEYKNFTDSEKYQHILNSSTILSALTYVSIVKINKLISKQKRKLDVVSLKKKVSTKICGLLTPEFFLCNDDSKGTLQSAVTIYADFESEVNSDTEWKVNEDKLLDIFQIMKLFPAVYSSENVQKMYMLYFCSLHKDLSSEFTEGNYKNLQSVVENNIIGILQQFKFRINDIFKIEQLCSNILEDCKCGEEMFSLVIENVFRCKDSIESCKSVVSKISKNLTNPLYMKCSIIIMNAVNKLKKSKMAKDIKNIADDYKELICDNILQLVLRSKPTESLLAGYAYSLKHFLSQNNAEKMTDMLNILDKYVQFAFDNTDNFGNIGYLTLFITVLQNKSKITTTNENFPLNVWNACKRNASAYKRSEEYSQLILLIVGHIPNEHFEKFMQDLLDISENAFAERDFQLFQKNFKTWEAVLSSDLNPIKCKVLQSALENLLYQIINLLENHEYNKDLLESVLNIEKIIIQTNHLHLTPAIMDILLLNITAVMKKAEGDFPRICDLSVSFLMTLLKHRKPLIMDRLPPYLQQYRIILRGLCKRSNCDSEIDESFIKQISDCAHQFEKLTKNLVVFQKDMGRIAMYLIADILEQYEQVTLLQNVKIHLNNCIYSLMSICDQHAVSYLMRVLSSASTEIFKIMYDNYKKYYRFTGKV